MACGPTFISTDTPINYNSQPQAPTYLSNDVQARWLRLPYNTLFTWLSEHTSVVAYPAGSHPHAVVVTNLCTILQAQEEALLWCISRYANVVSGLQLERDLSSLMSLDTRARLGQLPVFIMGLGQLVKQNRDMMWAYGVFRNIEVGCKCIKGWDQQVQA